MNLLRKLGVYLLYLGALPLLAVAWFIAMESEAKMMHVLDKAEMALVDTAAQYVDHHFAQHGRVPTAGEFKAWADQAPPHLRIDGVGFTYRSLLVPGQPAYEFSFWEGDAWVTWRSTSSDTGLAEASPTDAFFTGSKWADVLVFFGLGIAALLAAIVLVLPMRQAKPR